MKTRMRKKIGFTVFITVFAIMAPIMVLAPTNEGETWNEMSTDDRAIIYKYYGGGSWQKLKARYTDDGDWDYTGTTWTWTGDGDSDSKFRFWVDQEGWYLSMQRAYIQVRKHGDEWVLIAEDPYGADRADCNVQKKFSDLITDLGLVNSSNWYQFEAKFYGSFTFFGTTTYVSTFTVKFCYVA